MRVAAYSMVARAGGKKAGRRARTQRCGRRLRFDSDCFNPKFGLGLSPLSVCLDNLGFVSYLF
jgi:hypothetical protein